MSEPERVPTRTDRVPPHIVDAARDVLARDGLAAATLERISAAAGVSRMTLHRRGVSKEDILQALAARLADDYRQSFWPALVSKGTGRERLRLALEQLCDVTERNLSLHEALAIHVRNTIYHDDRGLTRNEFVEPLERLLLDGAADGSLAAVEPEEMATLLFNAVSHTYAHLRTGHRWPPDRARAGVVGLVLDGVGGRAADS
ncbi:MAG TPA: TetR/AcrR family transcriptional regulator [Solirubrobacteraceae bacterium]|nr:TetR/AcrR family transcriptional regulator [Solirubrobacteraceae bacterium]